MNRSHLYMLAFLPIACVTVADDLPGKPLKTVVEQRSYAIGLNVGRNIKGDGLELDVKTLLRGVSDAMSGANPLLSDAEIGQVMNGIQQELDRIAEQKAMKNLSEGKAFLAKNKAAPGVVTLESGLQYQVLKSGAGGSPGIQDTVTTHYHGTLLDGTVFDSSIERGRPATFPVTGVIRGWTEALQRMKVGDKWKLFVPSDLAYGPRGAGGAIGPHCVLIFEIELLAIEKQ